MYKGRDRGRPKQQKAVDMANTRSTTKGSPASVAKKATGKKVAKQAKPAKAEKQKSTVQSKKIEKELNEKKKEQKQEQEQKQEEEEFQLPSDSDNSDNEGSEESDTELAIHDDIISAGKDASSEANTKVSNQSGHTVIQPSSGSSAYNKSDKSDSGKSKRGVIYIGRLPNGFEEKELRKYFEQFGEITRLRLSRNKKTGKSKHYAFLEFKEAEVAKVAAETMDNYLLMGHLLSVSVLNSDKVHEKLFVGANIKFKVVPYGKINQLKHDKKKSKADWEKLNKNHINSIKSKQESLAAMGIDFDINNL